MNRHPAKLALALVLCGIFSSSPGQKKLYKWTDANGVVRYSDVLPPEAVKYERNLLNTNGDTVKTIKRAPTPEEQARLERLRKQQEEKKRLAAEQARRDALLLRIYHSEQAIIKIRDNQIATIDYNIRLEEETIKDYSEKISALLKSAAEHQRAGRKVPVHITRKIDEFKDLITKIKRVIALKRRKKAKIQKEFAQTLARYRILVAPSRPDDPGPDDKVSTSRR